MYCNSPLKTFSAKRLFILLFSLQTFSFGQVASDYAYTGIEATALAGAVAANPGGESSLFHNPAGLAELNRSFLAVGNSKIVNVPYSNFGFAMRAPGFGVVGLSAQISETNYKGTALSREQKISISNSFYLQKDRNSQLLFGYALNIFTWELGPTAGISGDGSDGFGKSSGRGFGIDLGFIGVLRGKHRVGAYLKNVNSPVMGEGESQQYLPRRLSVGVAYVPYQNLETSLVMDRLLGRDIQIKGGVQYTLNTYLTLRVGIQSNPNRLGAGLSLNVFRINFGYSLLTHPVLPITHQFGLKVTF